MKHEKKGYIDIIICPGRMMGVFVGVLAIWLVFACGAEIPEEKTLEIPFPELAVEPHAVSEMLSLVSPSHQPGQEDISPALQALFTYLTKTSAAKLVTTTAHSQGKWRVEKIFVLDDCVAVQMSEGHYLETLFFAQYSKGWRLTARISPQDHV